MAEDFFSHLDESAVVEAIRHAEARSRGEIRVHITKDPVDDVMAAAARAFEKLGMTRTDERNGVLVFVAYGARRFAVIGDSGVTSKTGAAPLEALAGAMGEAFRAGRFTDGLIAAVRGAGDLLETHFPRVEGRSDRDELSNEISRG